MNPRWKIVLIVSLLSVLMEFSLRGVNNFLKAPALSLLLFLNYFPYFAIVEEFIGRFHLKDSQVWIFAELMGLIWQLVSVAAIYYPPLFFGLNPGVLFINNIIWWPTIQTLFAFYIARRITLNADRSKPFLSNVKLTLLFVMYIAISASFKLFVPNFPSVTIGQYAIVLALVILSAYYFVKSIKANIPQEFKSNMFLDRLAVGMVIYCIFSFLFLTKDAGTSNTTLLNRQALMVNIVVSPLIALSLLIYRLKTKKTIPV